MKLRIDFRALQENVRKMGADERDFVLGVELSAIDPIDTELETGIVIGPDDIEYTSEGLLSYKGRQVLLYIQDHGGSIEKALADGSEGRKYHVAYCSTLEEMHKKGRFERYVVKNDVSGEFYITGSDYRTKKHEEGYTRLNVCKNCLKHLNYKNYKSNSYEVFKGFSLDEFFTVYESHFKYKPKREAGKDKDGTYSSTWKKKSREYRESVDWTCESCGVDLSAHRKLLHAHHKNGVKSDNSFLNLQALCIECHSLQPKHNLKVTYNQKQTLQRLRTKVVD